MMGEINPFLSFTLLGKNYLLVHIVSFINTKQRKYIPQIVIYDRSILIRRLCER